MIKTRTTRGEARPQFIRLHDQKE